MFTTGLTRSFSFSFPQWLQFSRSRSSEAAAFYADVVKDEQGLMALRHAWTHMIGSSQSPECIYQSPEFFAFTQRGDNAAAMPAVLCMKRVSDEAVAALVPARMMTYPLQFKLGRLNLLTVRVPVVQLLGSVPMAADNVPRHLIYKTLLERFPAARAVYMQALPQELHADRGNGLYWNIVHGWRKCLGVEIDGDYDGYMKGLPSKKRYNMTRQIRMLEQEAGGVQTIAVTAPGQAGQLRAALDALLDPAEAKAYPGAAYFERLAANGLLQSYVIAGASGPLAVVLGTRYQSTWYVHNIFTAQAYARLSPGTSAFLLALKDVTAAHRVAKVEFGYGSPNREFKSTHTAALRANALASTRLGVSLLVKAHGWLERANEAGIALLHRMRRTKRTAPA